MDRRATRYLYLTRHAESLPGNDAGLTQQGRRQATLLGRRLRDSPLSAVHHGPLPRAAETARLVGTEIPGLSPVESELAGDYVPHFPARDELPQESADLLLGFLEQVTAEGCASGTTLSREALNAFTGPVSGEEDQHIMLVTHNFLIAWLVRAAQDAPDWRWMGLSHCNAGLTVLQYRPGRPSAVLLYNDMSHLPPELRWTGFPPEVSEQLRRI